MSDSSRPTPDHRPGRRPRGSGSPDLDTLRTHPSLTSLSSAGWAFDELRAGRTAWAFAGTMLLTTIAFGVAATGVVLVLAVITVASAASAISKGETPTARRILALARVGLLVWMLLGATSLFFSSPAASQPGDQPGGQPAIGAVSSR
jgi:hypothetical protein